MPTIQEDAQALIDSYYAKNNSIGVMDSLLMNRQIIKSGMGYDTTRDPLTTDRYDTVHSIGRIGAVAGKVVTLKPDDGFEKFPMDRTVRINSDKAFHVGRYFYNNGDNSELSSIQKTYMEVNGLTP